MESLTLETKPEIVEEKLAKIKSELSVQPIKKEVESAQPIKKEVKSVQPIKKEVESVQKM